MKHVILKNLIPAIASVGLVGGAFTAAAISATPQPVVPVKVGEHLGTDSAEITKKLEYLGFSDFEIETEDDELEVEAEYENAEVEIEISPQTGVVISIELEDED